MSTKVEFEVGHDCYDELPTVDTPPGLIGIELFHHQKIVVRRLLDMEHKRYSTGEPNTNYSTLDMIITTSALILADPFGSGKTIEILAFILYRPVPRASPFTIQPTYTTGVFMDSIQYKYIDTEIIRPNLIVIANVVVAQWETAIKSFTRLRLFVVGNKHQLKEFINIFNKGQINTYDIILLKNSILSKEMTISGETSCNMITLVGILTSKYVWSRVIYDDFDMIPYNNSPTLIPALFTIYVSASRKSTRAKPQLYDNIHSMLTGPQLLADVHLDEDLFKYFRIESNSAFIRKSMNMPIINSYKYVYKNPKDIYMRLLMFINTDEAKDIMEMISADALKTAAVTLGIKSTNPADIFFQVVSKQFTTYYTHSSILDCINNFLNKFEYSVDTPAEYDQLSPQEICEFLENAKTPDCQQLTTDISLGVDELRTKYLVLKSIIGDSLRNIINVIIKESCPKCYKEGNSPHNLFTKDTYNLILILMLNNAKIKLDNCAKCKYPWEVRVESPPDDEFYDEDTHMEASNGKIQALIKLINGETPAEQEPQLSINNNTVKGVVDIPQVDIPRKIIIFANYNESLKFVKKHLTEAGINTLTLKGTYQTKDNIIRAFRNTPDVVLLINSTVDCAGINLQFCTDICFFHKVHNEHIEAQIIGRGQRIGRKYNLYLHYLYYTNENY